MDRPPQEYLTTTDTAILPWVVLLSVTREGNELMATTTSVLEVTFILEKLANLYRNGGLFPTAKPAVYLF
jgi:hypothetical protein